MARPPTSNFEQSPPAQERADWRTAQRETALDIIGRYNPDAVIVIALPFGHTRPQWILPYGGEVTIDAIERKVWASYD